jgi:cyclohexanecarboxyl-CoA dehydrogenase
LCKNSRLKTAGLATSVAIDARPPMDFASSAEQNAIVEMATRFARERLELNYRARERAGSIDREIAKEMGAMGLLGPELP